MSRKELIDYLNEFFMIHGFTKKGKVWFQETGELIKIIKLEKSKNGNYYYLDFGFIIKNLDLFDLEMHVFNRLSSLDSSENKEVINILDLDNNIDDRKRKKQLEHFIRREIFKNLNATNTESDLENALRKRPHTNDVPLIVKRRFNLS